jgi:hypothetical protein
MDKARTGLVAAVFLGLFFCCQLAGAQITANGNLGTISGRVVDATGTGISGVQVVVFQEPGPLNYTAQTDCSGFYMRSGIKAGSYTLQFAGTGFRLETRNAVRIEFSKGTKLDMQMQSGELKGERVSLEAYSGPAFFGSIAGTVTDLNAGAIPGAQIMAIDAMTGYLKETTTDQTGHYDLMVSPSGRYGVWAMQRGFKPEIVKAVPVGMETKAVIDIRLNVEDRSSVEVTPNPVPADAKQKVEAGGEIHGKVLDANGVVPARITATELATRKRYATTTDYRGDYRFAHLPEGNYCTKFEASGPRYGMPEPEYETSRVVRVEREGRIEFNMALPAIPGKN